MGTCFDSNSSKYTKRVYGCPSANNSWNKSFNGWQYYRSRRTTFIKKSIIIQMDSGTVLNDEDLPPLPDKLEKQLRKRL